MAADKDIQTRWVNFCKRILRFKLDIDLVIYKIIEFLHPPYNAIIHENEFFDLWDSEKGKYISNNIIR